MSAPGTPAPPTSPVVPAVETVEPPQATSPPQATTPGVEGAPTPHELADGQPITVQPQNGDPDFSRLPSVTPVPGTPAPESEKEATVEKPVPTWAHGLFGCFDMDIKLLGLTLCCPCITFGANAELLGEDWMLYCLFCVLPGPMCYFGPYIRQKIRQTFEIEATDENDVLAYLLCPCLSIIQETQQLKSAGMKPGGDAMNRV